MIKVDKLTKIYQTGNTELRAIDELSFEIGKGEFVSITGRSGSGKSTLLYQLGLLDRPSYGEILIDGHDVSKLSSKERAIFRLTNLGYVFQDYALIPTLTSFENVFLPLMMQGINGQKAKDMACEALTKVDLAKRFNSLPSQLSGGEQQRVSIARAVVNSPKILFADEPTANLDSDTAKIVLKALQDLNKQGQTLVMVTHEPDYAKLADRIFKLSDGLLVDIEVINKNTGK